MSVESLEFSLPRGNASDAIEVVLPGDVDLSGDSTGTCVDKEEDDDDDGGGDDDVEG